MTKSSNKLILPNQFFEARTPPKVDLYSYQNLEFYKEHLYYAKHGREINGFRFTGDYYWYMNFFPINLLVLDKNGKPTDEEKIAFPYPCQEDDYLFKQFEEAKQSGLHIFFITARGYGKTFGVISIPAKNYFLHPLSHNFISASIDLHASATFKKLKESIEALEKLHPTLRMKRLYDSENYMESGEEIFTADGNKETIGHRSKLEKIVYDKDAGKTRGTRPKFQLFEEVGAWTGAASLKKCYGESLGSFKRGSKMTCQVFFIGTGGQMESGGSADARDMFNNPDAFNIYPVKQWGDRKTAIFIPAHYKYGGYWEDNFIPDREGAKKGLEAEREQKKGDALTYYQFIQEYPFTPEEAFMVKGGNNFNTEILAQQKIEITENGKKLGKLCNLHWKRQDGKIVGVEIEYTDKGEIWLLEEPELDENGKVFKNLYVGGYDGIDLGKQDTASGEGSKGALLIKKRMHSAQRSNNRYVAVYTDRPKDIDDFYENALKLVTLFDCTINIEDTKRNIVAYFKQRKAMHRFMKRPRITLSTDPSLDKVSTLIGTTATAKNFGYGELYTAQYIKDYGHDLWFLPLIEQLIDFNMSERTKFDLVVAMFMTEIGDDELHDQQVKSTTPPKFDFHKYGYYTDVNGIRRYGLLPQYQDNPFANFAESGAFPGIVKSNVLYLDQAWQVHNLKV
ncbi:hypothetical protein [Mongoliitalea daihaiensis]|uniref:hypothetical protein n=1 Tax=Mongoliitalea daihaiensis TaxID=2782006 RepID=UPI001F47ABA6|nr:hypothetical protein [Mongoliitalea daihaiensis]UJP64008.1 hypothetical protein IPZ59_14415 [Mongoliitalea daihaiensis]